MKQSRQRPHCLHPPPLQLYLEVFFLARTLGFWQSLKWLQRTVCAFGLDPAGFIICARPPLAQDAWRAPPAQHPRLLPDAESGQLRLLPPAAVPPPVWGRALWKRGLMGLAGPGGSATPG